MGVTRRLLAMRAMLVAKEGPPILGACMVYNALCKRHPTHLNPKMGQPFPGFDSNSTSLSNMHR